MALRQVLEEQIRKKQQCIELFRKELTALPQGTIFTETNNGEVFYRLEYVNKDGEKVERYIKRIDVDILQHELQTRKQIEQWIKEMEEDIKIAEKALGSRKKSK